MIVQEPTSKSAALEYLKQHQDTMIRVGVTDIDGVLRGKFINREKFMSGLTSDLSICDCVLAWDADDALYEGYERVARSGWHTGFPDVPLRIAEDSMRLIADADGPASLFALCDFGGAFEDICPRTMLARVVDRAADMGVFAKCGFEYEFTLLRESGGSLRETTANRLDTLTHGNFGYSVLKTSLCSDLFCELQSICRRYDIALEALHTENGPGMWEAAIAPADAMLAADQAVIFKLAAKEFAARNGLTACFMAKLSSKLQGQGGHIHISLLDDKNEPSFYDQSVPDHVSRTFKYFLGGQQQLMPEFTVMSAPTINSYKRLMPDTWAPTVSTWGTDNRTGALRVVGHSPASLRVEYRLPGADANPYLALSAALASGLHGIENAIAPTEPVTGNAYSQEIDDELRLPRDLTASAARFRQSGVAAAWFGKAFVEHFVMSREWELSQFAKHISDWEIARYAEII